MFALDVPVFEVFLLCLCGFLAGSSLMGAVGASQSPYLLALFPASSFSHCRLTGKAPNTRDGCRLFPALSPCFLFACPVLFSSTSLLFSSYRGNFTQIACDFVSEWPAFRRAA